MIQQIVCCGIITHQEVGLRALNHYKDQVIQLLISNNLPTFYGSLAFSDFGFFCRKYSDLSEKTHWRPFLDTYFNYFIRNYGRNLTNLNQKGQELFVFYLGLETHTISDMPWHNLNNTKNGFIDIDKNLNFNGNYELAHCKFFLIHYLDNSDLGGDWVVLHQFKNQHSNAKWKIPLTDLSKIYKEFGYQISEMDLENCVTTQYLYTKFVSHTPDIYYLLGVNSPFLVEKLNNYLIGGIDDMKFKAMKKWDEIKEILTKKLENKNENIINEPQFHKKFSSNSFHKYRKDVLIERNKGELLISTKNTNIMSRIHEEDYSYCGSSVSSCGNILAIGCPGYKSKGRVKLIYEKSIIYIEGYENSLFGESILFMDFNRDGKDDLIISAPGYKTRGAIFIYFQNENQRFSNNYDVIIEGGYDDHIGFKLLKGDINNDGYEDLIIGSPEFRNFRGMVTIFLSKKNINKNRISIKDVDFLIIGEKEYSSFGQSILFIKENSYLIIGAPNEKTKIKSEGKIYCFKYNNNLIKFQKIFTIYGRKVHGKFGSSLSSNNTDILAVGSPTASDNHSGDVYIFNIKDLKGEFFIDSINHKVLNNPNRFGRFGWDIIFFKEKLIISEPYYSNITHNDLGKVYIYNSTYKNPLIYVNNFKKSKYGYYLYIYKEKLIISSPFHSDIGTHNGKIYSLGL